MKSMGPNLAARPFANERPAKRTTLLIWVLALTLLMINIFLYQRHLSAQFEQRQAIEGLQEGIEQAETAIARAESDLAALHLGKQNEKVVFLNGQIARRTFSWSSLFDRLEEVLPANVELHRVSPEILRQSRGRGVRRGQDPVRDLVVIGMRGDAQTGEELLQLVDNLFEHPSFTVPDLEQESQRDDGRLEFSLRVLYLPAAALDESVTTGDGGVEETSLPTDSAGGSG